MEANSQFGRYQIIKALGSGATSDVFLAHDTTLERDVALKILKPALVSDQTSFSRFSVEAQAAGKLFHDNIATVLDMGETDGCFYIAMRYIDGMSLDKYLQKNGSLPWEMVKKLAGQIGSALSYAHAQGYIHRDIKSNNIMVSSKGDFVLTDFGLTRAMHESGMTSTTGAVLGTPPYIPPEIWNGKEASPLSDQYSFACVIDEAITGRLLFSGGTPQEVITKHLVNKPEISGYPKTVPENVRFILQKALSKNSQERFADIQSFCNALMEPEKFDTLNYLKKIKAQEQSVVDKKNLEKLKAKKRRKVIAILVAILSSCLLVTCGIGALVYQDQLSQIRAVFSKPDDTQILPTEEPTATTFVSQITDTLFPVSTLPGTPSLMASNTSTDSPTSTPTNKPNSTPVSDEKGQVAQGSGVEITILNNGSNGLAIYFFRGDGSPIKDLWVGVWTQKQDLSGNWVKNERIIDGNTDNTGLKLFDIPPGNYIIEAGFYGYNWGSASDVQGQVNVPVEAGKQTQLILRLARLKVGFVFADGSVCSNKWVGVWTQQKDISGNWVTLERVRDANTDNTGVYEFDLTAGNYMVEADFFGYNWGDALKMEGESNIPLYPGQVFPLVKRLGRIVVELKDTNNNPIDNKYVAVYFQNKDVNGNPISGERVIDSNTNNTGSVKFDLTPGTYAIFFDEIFYYNINVESGKITTTNGNTTKISN